MNSPTNAHRAAWPVLAWLTVALLGIAAPTIALLALAETLQPLLDAGGPILALGLMGLGMIAAAASGRLWVGVVLALLGGVWLIGLAGALGMPPLLQPLFLGFAIVIATLSFTARGALFARSALDKGWLIALFVVAGEAAFLITAWVEPGSLPDWLLVLLPAQWANMAFQAALTGKGTTAAIAPLIALGGTAATTLLVARLLPRRWPYLLMFSAWLGLSALVWYWPVISGDPAMITAPS
ncbi:hypothetical protein [Erythrobacter sp. YT30]|uniref:hypothetical protein n=1 Tax=Erythrobacter sp. YT30 TaxID=1735012 RepID=UPI00076D075E|nr:hypothetical protein [Erythrobacter sp. YT30]KWV91091.1 hypothetical protein AUC45_07170 [Erythrobacter sp. YT30]